MLAGAPCSGALSALRALRHAPPMGRTRATVRALRETGRLSPDHMLSEYHLARYRLTQEEYTQRATQQIEARAAYLEAMTDPSLGPEDKHNIEATYHVTWGRSYFKCPGCMLAPALCVCGALARRAPPAAGVPPHRLRVLMHHKEHGRASNTGCLLAPALGATIHVAGVVADEAALATAVAAARGAVAILWPGEGALTVEELRAATPPDVWDAGLMLIAVDGNWASARKMIKRLPDDVPRLALSPEAFAPGRSLLFPVRKYSGPCAERFCTYEAVVALMDALGALQPGEREALTLNLKLKVDALLKHKNRRAAYGAETGAVLAEAQAALLDELRRE